MKVLSLLVFLTGVLALPALGEAESTYHPGNIILPSVEFVSTPLLDAVSFLEVRARELDVEEPDPDRKGFNIVLIGEFDDVNITLRLSHVPIMEVVKVVAELAGANLHIRKEYCAISRGELPEVVIGNEGTEKIQRKLNQIVVPNIEFVGTPLRDAIAFLNLRSVELDAESPEPDRGVNLVLNDPKPKPITLNLRNVSLTTALEVVALASGCEMEIRPYYVILRKRPAGS